MKKKVARDKLFPGKVRWQDLLNPRYISRKPIYDFLVEQSKETLINELFDTPIYPTGYVL